MAAPTHHPADSASEWTVEPFVPADGATFTAADLGPLQPLWNSLMDRHREAWERVSMRSHQDSWPRRRAQYLEWLAEPGSFVLVARRGDQLIGYLLVATQEADETYMMGERQAEIETLAVLPGERGVGIGSALMDEAERLLRVAGIRDVLVATMHGNDAAQRFYERRGFTPFVHINYRRLEEE